MKGWMYGRKEGRTDIWMDGLTDGRMEGRMDRRTGKWTDGRMDRQKEGQMDRQTDRLIDQQTGFKRKKVEEEDKRKMLQFSK